MLYADVTFEGTQRLMVRDNSIHYHSDPKGKQPDPRPEAAPIGTQPYDGDLECIILPDQAAPSMIYLTSEELSIGLALALSNSGDGPDGCNILTMLPSYKSLDVKLRALATRVGHDGHRFIP